MAIDCRAEAFHRKTGDLEVVFSNDEVPAGIRFSIHVAENEDRFPSGAALDELIRSHIPHGLLAQAARGELPAAARPAPRPLMLFDVGTIFIAPGQASLFQKRPLLLINNLPIPLDIR